MEKKGKKPEKRQDDKRKGERRWFSKAMTTRLGIGEPLAPKPEHERRVGDRRMGQ